MPASEAARLSTMPTIVTNYTYGQLDGTYILPPILYPDGKYYLKLGHHDKFEDILTTSEAIKDWYDKKWFVPIIFFFWNFSIDFKFFCVPIS